LRVFASRTSLVSLKGLEVFVIIFGALMGVTALYVGVNYPSSNAVAQQQSGPYRLTLMEIMDTAWNSSTAQPQFFMIGTSGLQPSGNIQLPVRTLIQLTIISYDTATADSSDAEGKVTGTIDNTVYVINGTAAMGTDVSQRWGQNETSVPGATLAHTFTIEQLGINIPVVGGDAEIVYLYLNQTGTFPWICLTPCGFGHLGMMGAMSMLGWMEGQITVY